MKVISISLFILLAGSVFAQSDKPQSGTPAILTAANDKQARVFLQHLKDGKLTFQAFKATRNVTVNASRVKNLTFNVDWDQEAAIEKYNNAEYKAMLASLERQIKPYAVYMPINNNLRDIYAKMMEAYRKVENYKKVREIAEILLTSDDPGLVQRSYVNLALVAIAEDDIEKARTVMEEVKSEAAMLYLQASIERAEGRPKDAIRTVSGIIINHANDLEWLGPSELLCAYLYMDMLGPDAVITTNSPMYTARQVKNIYQGDSVSADAAKLWASLGGEAVEAAAQAKEEEVERIEAEKRAKREAETAQRRAELEAKEAQEALEQESAEATMPDADGADTNLTTTTEEESE